MLRFSKIVGKQTTTTNKNVFSQIQTQKSYSINLKPNQIKQSTNSFQFQTSSTKTEWIQRSNNNKTTLIASNQQRHFWSYLYQKINRTFWWRHKDSLWAHKKLIWDLWKSDELIVKSKEEAKKAALDILPGTTNRDPKHQEERREELQWMLDFFRQAPDTRTSWIEQRNLAQRRLLKWFPLVVLPAKLDKPRRTPYEVPEHLKDDMWKPNVPPPTPTPVTLNPDSESTEDTENTSKTASPPPPPPPPPQPKPNPIPQAKTTPLGAPLDSEINNNIEDIRMDPKYLEAYTSMMNENETLLQQIREFYDNQTPQSYKEYLIKEQEAIERNPTLQWLDGIEKRIKSKIDDLKAPTLFPRRGFKSATPREFFSWMSLEWHWVGLDAYQRKWQIYKRQDANRLFYWAYEIDLLISWQQILRSPLGRKMVSEETWQRWMQRWEEQKMIRVKAIRQAVPHLRPYESDFAWANPPPTSETTSSPQIRGFFPDTEEQLENILALREQGKFTEKSQKQAQQQLKPLPDGDESFNVDDFVETQLAEFDTTVRPREAVILRYLRNVPRAYKLWKDNRLSFEDFAKLNNHSERLFTPIAQLDNEDAAVFIRFPMSKARTNQRRMRLRRRMLRKFIPRFHQALVFQEPALVWPLSHVHFYESVARRVRYLQEQRLFYVIKMLKIHNKARLSGFGREMANGTKYHVFVFYAVKIQYQMNFFKRRWVGSSRPSLWKHVVLSRATKTGTWKVYSISMRKIRPQVV